VSEVREKEKQGNGEEMKGRGEIKRGDGKLFG
jgi:hypothetical protein